MDNNVIQVCPELGVWKGLYEALKGVAQSTREEKGAEGIALASTR